MIGDFLNDAFETAELLCIVALTTFTFIIKEKLYFSLIYGVYYCLAKGLFAYKKCILAIYLFIPLFIINFVL